MVLQLHIFFWKHLWVVTSNSSLKVTFSQSIHKRFHLDNLVLSSFFNLNTFFKCKKTTEKLNKNSKIFHKQDFHLIDYSYLIVFQNELEVSITYYQ